MCLRCGFGIDSLDSRASFGPLTTYADADTIEIVPLSCPPAWKTGSMKLETFTRRRDLLVDRKTLATHHSLIVPVVSIHTRIVRNFSSKFTTSPTFVRSISDRFGRVDKRPASIAAKSARPYHHPLRFLVILLRRQHRERRSQHPLPVSTLESNTKTKGRTRANERRRHHVSRELSRSVRGNRYTRETTVNATENSSPVNHRAPEEHARPYN